MARDVLIRQSDNIVLFQPAVRSVLLAHANAELGNKPDASAELARARQAATAEVIDLSDILARRYGLDSRHAHPTSSTEAQDLDIDISNREFALIMRPAA